MSRQGTIRRAGDRTARLAPPLARALAVAALLGSAAALTTPALAQDGRQSPPTPAPSLPQSGGTAPSGRQTPPTPAPSLPQSGATAPSGAQTPPPVAPPGTQTAPAPGDLPQTGTRPGDMPQTGTAPAAAPTLTPVPAPAPPPGTVVSTPAPAPAVDPAAPGTAVVNAPGVPVVAAPVLPADLQVVRFHGPEGVRVEVLGPNPEPVPLGDNHGIATVGLKVGVPYRLRITGIPERPEGELYPVIEMVGHLHRPPGIDPGKYPVRVVFSLDDLYDALDRGRLITQVVYLEDPEHALPIKLPKDEIPTVALNPSEDPLRVAAALGRVVAIVRTGNRRPVDGEPPDIGFDPGIGGPCPFAGPDLGRCPVACGPVCGTPPPAGKPWMPRDEFLCDGGDRGEPLHFAGDGGLTGIDPRDALVRFNDGRRPRVLPTNTVCVYAPRFAQVRTSLGTNEAVKVEGPVRTKYLERMALEAAKQGPNRLTQNTGAELARLRERPSGLASRVRPGVHSELRVLSGYDASVGLVMHKLRQKTELTRDRDKAMIAKLRQKADAIKTAESAVVTGIVEGAGQMVMTWTPRETVGVETPPNKPGLAVIKRVSAGEAEAGDVLTYVIQYRNMGNTPIRSVAIVDSLLPRLEYVPRSAKGPAGTVFTSGENKLGSVELRWEIPGAIAPGAEGAVEFQAVVR